MRDGELVPLSEQDRTRWDPAMIAEGVTLLERVLPRGHVGRFQLQAAIAAVHAESRGRRRYCFGPKEGLALADPLLDDPVMARHHRTHAVRAHLLELIGDHHGALESYCRAAQLTAGIPEQRYLNTRIRRLLDAAAEDSARDVGSAQAEDRPLGGER